MEKLKIMFPKLKAFYMLTLLPELSCPRVGMYPGIGEPGPEWVDYKFLLYALFANNYVYFIK